MTAGLAGTGKVVLGGGTSQISSTNFGEWVNGYGHTIQGAGSIMGPFTNYGDVIADGGTLSLSGTINNSNVIKTAGVNNILFLGDGTFAGGLYKPAGGVINISGGAILQNITLGEGIVNYYGTSDLFNGSCTFSPLTIINLQGSDLSLKGSNIQTTGSFINIDYGINHEILGNYYLGDGAGINVNNRGILSLKKDGGLNPILTNNGTIRINSGSYNVPDPQFNDYAYMRADGCTATLTGGGAVVLGGGINSRLYAINGGSWVNGADHTLRGSGYIEGPLTNEGLIIADNGTLNLSGTITNHTVMAVAGAGKSPGSE